MCVCTNVGNGDTGGVIKEDKRNLYFVHRLDSVGGICEAEIYIAEMRRSFHILSFSSPRLPKQRLMKTGTGPNSLVALGED